uniref:Ras guanine nucleotide exchange factor glfB-like C-terminal domain-containing protein n=1 Tax=Paramoeba aestuarina TaxID=180227 RepID=A0A7S4JQU4_9EUKA|eukprot:CAMPEP_0201512206 /NCGR_PEP_ID=MMETSP0161_2-20130828/4506_1 /ASSEMBLY_ACC=CAM_ASM_000251 /TAXON_ID=180227 /ORGANISM="Neoparamoeba aestuarina, Strain SoJaBio B1-5/56/2" /LENGTH=567 /DNA_ID=CAMNT_0047907961 /DNA_START=192 /DNA_END=1895 /DNA_ORIENTATION=+
MAAHPEGKNRVPEIEQEILGIHSREMQATTVAQDLPRLASRVTVVDYCHGNPKVLFRGSVEKEKKDEREVLVQILKTLASHDKIKPASSASKFIKSLEKHFGPDLSSKADLGKTFKDFVEKEEALRAPSPFVNVLKCLNQEIPFPIVKMLRDSVHQEAPFKDKRGSWFLRIEIFEDKTVVKHIKSNQSRSAPDPLLYYEFTWELALILRANDPLVYNFHLLDVTIGKHANEETRNLVTKLLNGYKSPTYNALSMWKRPIEDGEVLAESTCIFCTDFKITSKEKIIFEVAGGSFSVESALSMCKQLAMSLGEEEICQILDKFPKEEYDKELSVKDTMTQFWATQPLDEDSRTIQILKAIHPDLAIGAVMKMKNEVSPQLKYKGCRNTWRAEVNIADRQVVVSVSKHERSECKQEEAFFEFEWENSCQFDLLMWEMKDVSWRISDLRFHNKTTKDVQDLAQKVLAPYISILKPFQQEEEPEKPAESPVPRNVSSITLQQALQSLTRTLRPMEGELPEVEVEGEKPVSVISLLESMYHSSTRSDYPLPVVYLSRRERWAIGNYKKHEKEK